MSIYDKDLWGRTKHQLAIDRIRAYCVNGRTPLVAFSGGKDSQCCYHLCEEAGITFEAQYSITRFEPPELLDFIRTHYPSIKFRRAFTRSLIAEIEEKGLPNMWARWCCDAKHSSTKEERRRYIYIIGVRAEESPKRKDTWRMFGFKPDGASYICPIIDWTEQDVWEYLGDRPHCKLYDEGFKRIGCVMCPLVPQQMTAHAERWPKTAAVLRKGADRFVRRMRAQGFVTKRGRDCPDWCRAESPEDEFWNRWLLTAQTAKPVQSADAEDDSLCLFAGTGFDEKDGGEVCHG